MSASALDTPVSLPALRPDPASRFDPFPLTDIQRAYWLGRNPGFELGNIGIHVYEEIDVVDLDVPRLEAAWRRVLARHDMLRAVVLPSGQQQVLRDGEYRLQVRDLRDRDAEAQRQELLAAREAMSHRVYSPTEWPMFAIVVCRLDARRSRLLVSVDALNVDMGSFKIVFGEWVALYNDPACPLSALVASYRDYAVALESVRFTDAYRRSSEYWMSRARALPPAPDLPRKAPFSAIATPRFERRSARLDADRWTQLKERAAAHGLTPSALTLAAYQEALATWSRSPELTINVTLFNRMPLHPQIGDVVGDFTSMVLLGADGRAGRSRIDRARRLQSQLWQDVEHRWISGVQVLREVARHQGKRGGEVVMPCVFTSTLSVRARGLLPLDALGTRVFSTVQTPQVSLDLHVSEDRGALSINLDAVSGLYPDGLLDDFFREYESLLVRLGDDHEAWTETTCSLTPVAHLDRRRRINETSAPCRALRLDDIFLQTAARYGSLPAVIANSRELTYSELDRLSSHVARQLLARGVQSDSCVGILMRKRWEQVPAVLGALRAGAAYLPIDPQWPEARRRRVCRDADVRIVLTSADDDVAGVEGCELLTVDDGADFGPARGSRERSSVGDLAYVLYTSGSTGEPNGVMIEHHSVVNRIDDVTGRFSIDRERVLAVTALHHDLSVFDLFGSLATGGALVIPDTASLLDPRHWLDLIERHHVTVWNSVPAFMELLVSYLESAPGQATRAASVRLVLLSGDWIPVSLAARLRNQLPHARLVSLGGPTETTVWDIAFPVDRIDPAWRSILYGRPLANATYHVLDGALQPRPDWVPGELYIGGTGLARGYWRNTQRTSERFVVHPDTGERLFRSGDLGRALPDGNIEILGRVDHQLKIRGQRIEAGEIEHALRQDDGVKDVLVTTAGTSDSDKRLVAYVVLDTRDAAATASEETVRLAAYKLAGPARRRDLGGRRSVTLQRTHTEPIAETRASCRRFADARAPLDALSRLLDHLRAIPIEGRALPKYRYPSAGSLYPVQTYVHVRPNAVEGLDAGFYYHEAERHELVQLSTGDLPVDAHAAHNRAMAAQCHFTVLLVAQLNAIRPVYGERARDFCLLEAGCMVQLLMTAADGCGIGLCPIGQIQIDDLREPLALSDDRVLLHSLVGGTSGGPHTEAAERRLRARLSSVLPAYMIPSELLFVDRLPLSPNGKVDRSCLSASSSPVAPAPSTGAEEVIVDAVRSVLRVPEPNRSARFLDLGTTSLQLVQIATDLSSRLQQQVPVLWLLEHPTIRQLAQRIESCR